MLDADMTEKTEKTSERNPHIVNVNENRSTAVKAQDNYTENILCTVLATSESKE